MKSKRGNDGTVSEAIWRMCGVAPCYCEGWVGRLVSAVPLSIQDCCVGCVWYVSALARLRTSCEALLNLTAAGMRGKLAPQSISVKRRSRT